MVLSISEQQLVPLVVWEVATLTNYKLTLFYTRGLGLVVLLVMVLNHTGFPFAFDIGMVN